MREYQSDQVVVIEMLSVNRVGAVGQAMVHVSSNASPMSKVPPESIGGSAGSVDCGDVVAGGSVALGAGASVVVVGDARPRARSSNVATASAVAA